jgi:hypothetical protein
MKTLGRVAPNDIAELVPSSPSCSRLRTAHPGRSRRTFAASAGSRRSCAPEGCRPLSMPWPGSTSSPTSPTCSTADTSPRPRRPGTTASASSSPGARTWRPRRPFGSCRAGAVRHAEVRALAEIAFEAIASADGRNLSVKVCRHCAEELPGRRHGLPALSQGPGGR